MSTAPVAAPTERIVKLVPIEKIIEDRMLQIRDSVDPVTVADYEEIIVCQGSMDPVVAYRIPDPNDENNTQYLLSDGFHRMSAYRNLGKKVVPTEIHEGTRSDALEEAILGNCRHGKPLSNKDKHRAIELAVNDPEVGKKSDARISKMFGVSTSFVNTIRRGVKPESRRKKEAEPRPKTDHRQEKREEPEDDRPTAKACIRQLEEWLRLDVIEEAQVIKSLESAEGCYHWSKKPGKMVGMKFSDRFGELLAEVQVRVVSMNEERVAFQTSKKELAKICPKE